MKRLFCIAILLTACATTATNESPRTAVDAFLAALNAGDVKIAELFTEDATVFFPMNNQPLRASGRAEISSVFGALFGPNYRGGVPTPDDIQIQRAGDAAVVTFQLVNPNVTSRRTFVLRREAGRWLIVHLHGSNIRKE